MGSLRLRTEFGYRCRLGTSRKESQSQLNLQHLRTPSLFALPLGGRLGGAAGRNPCARCRGRVPSACQRNHRIHRAAVRGHRQHPTHGFPFPPLAKRLPHEDGGQRSSQRAGAARREVPGEAYQSSGTLGPPSKTLISPLACSGYAGWEGGAADRRETRQWWLKALLCVRKTQTGRLGGGGRGN